jgi:UDP-N-acetylmuramoyl-L-alanyl-D-glutamate--2,6-diaminopimelate ligase
MTAGNTPSKTVKSLGLTEFGGADALAPETSVLGVAVDSREVARGFLFAAMPGVNVHGAEFADFARRMGALAILTDGRGANWITQNLPDFDVPVLIAEDARLALSQTAARFYDAQPEVITAVTGTNGKTSVASFTRQIWEHAGMDAVNFGTTGVEGMIARPLEHTTPEPLTLHALLDYIAAQGVTHAAMEASSHGLQQRRLDGVHLTAGAFTNLTRDHLDYHADFEEYFAAKARLFDAVLHSGAVAVINTDDHHSDRMIAAAKARDLRVILVGERADADLRLSGQRCDETGQDIRFVWMGEARRARLNLIGTFQGHNALTAAALAIGCGMEAEPAFHALSELKTVRGRMELAAQRQNGAAVFVDYAHTPHALRSALTSLRPHVMGRLIVVFGAGGDRDPGKRIIMGRAAAQEADVVFVTDDNPRTEDAAQIRAQVMEGCPKANEIADRAEAILAGVDALQPGDALLIAGKGHETGQIVGSDVYPFDDVEQASISVAALDGMGV